jgi:ubiquinone/menaquinone biosynthesis C-methylase UbiE
LSTLDAPPHSYERFSKQPFCVAVDQALLLHARPAQSAADLGAGTGTSLEHLFTLGRIDDDSRVVAIDADVRALELARAKFADKPHIGFLLAQAERTPLANTSIALVTVCNSIHLMDPVPVLREIHRVLIPGGMMLINTAYERLHASPSGTARSWGMIVSLARRHPMLRDYPDIPHPVQLKSYSGDEYRAMAEAAGFRDVIIEYHTVSMDRAALQAICDYEAFAMGALPGVPVELATRALVEAVDPALVRCRIDAIPRTWMFLRAQKTPAHQFMSAQTIDLGRSR